MTTPRARRSRRIADLQQSEIRAMTRACTEHGGINLGQGICDLPTPPQILKASSQAVLDDKSIYSKYEGIDALRRQVAKKAREFNRLTEVDEDHDVIVTIGATGALAATAQALFDPGDEVILFEPYYGYHVNTLRVSGVTPRFVTLDPPKRAVSLEDLESRLTPKTRAVLFSNPTNPSGKVWTRSEFEVLGEFCRKHDLLAISDEIYEYIVYEGSEHVSLASMPGMWERTVTLSGFSKTFSITGWRLGTVVAPRHLSEAIGLVHDLFYVCAPTPLQHGLAEGMSELAPSYYGEMARDYEQKRDRFCEALERADLKPVVPDGAYYVLADISRLGKRSSKEAAMEILKVAGVASVPGSAFFISPVGERYTRFCYAKDDATLDAAIEALGKLA